MSKNSEPKLFTPRAISELLEMHIDSVRRKIRKGQLEAKNVGGEDSPEYLVPKRALEPYIVRSAEEAEDDYEGP